MPVVGIQKASVGVWLASARMGSYVAVMQVLHTVVDEAAQSRMLPRHFRSIVVFAVVSLRILHAMYGAAAG